MSEDEMDLTAALADAGASDGSDAEDEAALYQGNQAARLAAGRAVVKSSAAGKKGGNKQQQQKSLTGGGSFQSLGLSASLLKTLLQRGFNTPTPIQRLAMPAILTNRDVVGMARTGSGKTLAYMVPLLQRLGTHQPIQGSRALIFVPTRELALQVLKVGKDLSRGMKEGGDPLRFGLVVGGEGLEDQFETMANNPDVLIATPGRLLHLVVEMSLDFRAAQYVVFDEADRLFEMGFAVQLHELLSRLPASRQTLLFSATLPKSLVEFAKAGLQNPKLVRLDAESKISTDLRMAFLSVKATDKEGALLCLLRDVIHVPLAREQKPYDKLKDLKKRKREGQDRTLAPSQAIIFTATKHHVEYLTMLLADAGYSVSQIYGSLDQTNRKIQLHTFRTGQTQLLVVTDLAARGLDIPLLQNVINYDFPVGSRNFVHRVGRTARAGQKGWAYSLVTNTELPYLYELELFLSRPITTCPTTVHSESDYTSKLILGTLPRDSLDNEIEHVRTVLVEPNTSLVALLATVQRAQKMYERSNSKASPESYRRAKVLIQAGRGLAGSALGDQESLHPIFVDASDATDQQRRALLNQIGNFKPNETVFELAAKNKETDMSKLLQNRRKLLDVKQKKKKAIEEAEAAEIGGDGENREEAEEFAGIEPAEPSGSNELEQADEEQLVDVFGDGDAPRRPTKKPKGKGRDFRDESVYLGYQLAGADTEKGYSLTDGADSFAAQAANATFALPGDEDASGKPMAQKASTLRWDRKSKRVVKGDGTGADNQKFIKTESGTKLPASFQSGKYDEWRKKKRVSVPRPGDSELPGRGGDKGGRKWKHEAAPPKREKKEQFHKDRQAAAKPTGKQLSSTGRKLKSFGKPGVGKAGLRSMDQIAKERKAKAGRVRRSNQPSKKKKGKK